MKTLNAKNRILIELIDKNGTDVTIPNSVVSINPFVFAGCTNFTSETIPGSVTIIGNCVFESCLNLKKE